MTSFILNANLNCAIDMASRFFFCHQHQPLETMTARPCLCGTAARLRCTKCRQEWYCSVDCQRSDWKRHRLECRALGAAKELTKLVQGSTMDQAHEDFYRAKDEVERILEDKQREAASEKRQAKANPAKLRRTACTSAVKEQSRLKKGPCKQDDPEIWLHSDLELSIQDMSNLSCYQLQLKGLATAELETSLLTISGQQTTFSLRSSSSKLLDIRLPGIITSVQAFPVDDENLSIRLAYVPRSFDDAQFSDRPHCSIQPSAISTLSCRYCQSQLISDCNIQRVQPLPSGRWEDMTDYLQCYPGQPVVDIGATTCVPSLDTAFEDDACIVLDARYFSSTVSVVPATGYGEDATDDEAAESTDTSAECRGRRPWRALVVGATLTCSVCMATLGYAADPESMRLLKHRVQWGGPSHATVMDFVAHEMIRYAETKAIFAFEVRQENDEDSLWLRLISWDGKAATIGDGVTDAQGKLQWKRLVQIMFEQTTRQSSTTEPSEWLWTTDWCCAPDKEEKQGPENTPPSVVQLCLEQIEWLAVKDALVRGSSFHPATVREATIMAKTGRKPRNTTGLAAVLL